MEDPESGRSSPGQSLWLTDMWFPTSAPGRSPFLPEISDHCRQSRHGTPGGRQVPGRKYQMEVCRSRREKSGRYPADQNFCNSYYGMHKIKNGIFPLRKRAFRNFSLKALPQNSSLFYCRTLSLPCASITGLIRGHRYDTDRGDPSRSLQKIQRIHRHAVF